ncbi:MAG TPA: DUF4388 domain-containing protein [Chloroflexota bacterium]|nr:DUF4388 domain-containing protein [Chloroflexota bacterium]
MQGSIPDFTVVDVMRLLGSATKTGVVRFNRGRGGITQSGAVYFRDGVAVAAETDGVVGAGALELLCSWDSGSFSYHDGATTHGENLDQPFDWLLQRAEEAEEEWREILGVFPSPTSIVRLTADLPEGVEGIRIDRTEWRVLAAAGTPQTVSVLAQLAGGGLASFRLLKKLAQQGLIECRGNKDERWESRDALAAGRG